MRYTIEGPPPNTRWQVAGGRTVCWPGAILVETSTAHTADFERNMPGHFTSGDVIDVPRCADLDHLIATGFMVPPGTPSTRPTNHQAGNDGSVFGEVSVIEAGSDPAAIGLVRTVTR